MSSQQRLEFLAGAIGGLLSDAVVHPVDSARANLQTNRVYSHTVDALRRMSVSQMYRGFGMVAVCTIPAHGLYFAGYETTKRWLGDSSASHFASGFSADVWGSLVWTPMDVVKQRLQVRSRGYHSSWGAVRRIFAEQGVKGFYAGYWASLATYGPFVGIYFSVYEQLKLADSRVESDFVPQVVAGALAGLVAAALTNPLDVIKTTVQVREGQTALQVTRGIIAKSGMRGFFRGIGARISWITPGTALTIAIYEQTKIIFHIH